MNKKQLLFVHQNFPGQYRYLAKHYAQSNDWDVYAIGEKPCVQRQFYLIPKNIRLLGYDMPEASADNIPSRLKHFASNALRADALTEVLLRQQQSGLNPDVILAHPGWGEGLYLKEIFPNAKLIYLFEYFFNTTKNNINFDPGFPSSLNQQLHCRMSNTANLIALDVADVAVSPTQWQRDTHPKVYRDNMHVIHEGVDTTIVKPTQASSVSFMKTSQGDITLSGDTEIISYSVRNLEPSRGFHRFMRALPKLQTIRPNATFVIVGGEEKSYSASHPSGQSWKEVMLAQVSDQLDLERVIFTGKIPYNTLLDLFSITDLHLYWTTPFVLSWSLMEAMACEAAVLASSTGPVLEVVSDEENGFLFDYFNENELVEKVNHLMNNPELRSRIGKRARESIVEKYDLHSHCLPQYIQLIEEQ